MAVTAELRSEEEGSDWFNFIIDIDKANYQTLKTPLEKDKIVLVER